MTNECKKCGKYLYNDFDIKHHTCKKFFIYNPYEGSVYERYGVNAYDVVEQFSMEYNQDDPVLNEDIFEMPISVTDNEGVEKWFNVYAEPEINYYPKEVEPPSQEDLEKLK